MSGFDAAGLVGQILSEGRWTVHRMMDDGEFGTTYLAADAELETEVLLRFPATRLRADGAYCRKFAETVEALYTVQPLQFLPVIDVGVEAGSPLAVIQATASHTLADELGSSSPTVAQLLNDLCNWLPTVCAGLDALRSQKIWHRDLRPGTLWRAESGQVWIGDVSLSHVATVREQLFGRQLTDTGLAYGTPEYMAPELIVGVRYDGAVDQYALCATIYELISCRPPYLGSSPTAVLLAHTRDPVPDLASVVPDVGRDVADLLMRGMAKEPRDRFPSCLAFAQALVATVRGEPIPEPQLERARASGVFDRPMTAESTYREVEQAVDVDTPPPASSRVSTAKIPRTVTAAQLTSQPPRRNYGRWIVIGLLAAVVAVGGWFGWTQLSGGASSSEFSQPLARKSLSAESRERLRAALRQPLPKLEPATTLEATFRTLVEQAGLKPNIDVDAIKGLGINPAAKVDVTLADRSIEQALHQLVNRNENLRILADSQGEQLLLTSTSPTDRGELTAMPLGATASGLTLIEQLQLPVDQNLAGLSFEDALQAIRSASRMTLMVDEEGIAESGLEPGPVPAAYDRDLATAQEALAELVQSYGNLEALTDENQRFVMIVTAESAEKSPFPRVADLQPPKVSTASIAATSPAVEPASGGPNPAGSMSSSGAPQTAGGTQTPGSAASIEPYRPPSEPIMRLPQDVVFDPRESQSNGLGSLFILVTPGEFLMGAANDDVFAQADEQPEHLVKVTQGYWIGQTEVTLREFRAVLGRDPVGRPTEAAEAEATVDPAVRPVTDVTWYDALEYCNALSSKEGLSCVYELQEIERNDAGQIVAAKVVMIPGPGYRLPTEAEWEFASRAGKRYPPVLTDPAVDCEPFAWTTTNADGKLQPVGLRTPNRWRLCDMQGNVREWVLDGYEADAYDRSSLYDPVAPIDLPERVVRGGAFNSEAILVRTTAREGLAPGHADPCTGFRVARSAM